jgi:prevent-host-death family protein
MALEVSVADAKARLSNLINSVAFGGERIIIRSRGRPKAALIGMEDLRRLEGCPPARISRAQRRLALAQAARVREALRGFKLSDAAEDLARLRQRRLRDLS